MNNSSGPNWTNDDHDVLRHVVRSQRVAHVEAVIKNILHTIQLHGFEWKFLYFGSPNSTEVYSQTPIDNKSVLAQVTLMAQQLNES